MILLSSGLTEAANITVCTNGCDFSSVKAAVSATSPGDTIEIYSGQYFEDVVMSKDIMLRGINTGGGKPSLGVIHLCGHPESSVSGISYSLLDMGCPPGQQGTPKSTTEMGTDPGKTSSSTSSDATGNLLYLNDFSTSVPLVDFRDYKKEYSVAYKAGRLYVSVQKEDYIAAVNLPKGGVFDDFTLEADGYKEAGSDDVDYGFILRQVDENNYYRFRVTADGRFGFDKLQDGNRIDLVPLDKSDAVHIGKAGNHIKVECRGNSFAFYINGIEVGKAKDDSFAYGVVSLEAGTHSTGNAKISFDNMMIWSLPSGGP